MLISKIGDSVVGICGCSSPPYPDVGIITVGDPTHIDMGSLVGRVGDSVTFSCGVSTIVSGTPMHISGGTIVARTGDNAVGCGTGTIISSSMNVTM